MRLLTQTVLAWLLMLAIPMQGFAATAMLFCAPSHHGSNNVAVVELTTASAPTSSEHRGHHHADTSQSEHRHSSSVPSSASSDVGDTSILAKISPLKVGKIGDGKCSACAVCCIGSALVSAPSTNPVAMTGSDSIPFTLESFVSYVSEGLDPPPRFILA